MLSEHFGSGRQQTLHVGLVARLCLTASPVRSTHDQCTQQASGMACDSDVMENSKSYRGAGGTPSNSSLMLFEKVSFCATTPAPVIVRVTFSWPIYLLFLFSSSGNCLKNVATDFYIPFQRLVAMKQSQDTLKNQPFSTAERSKRVENFLLRATCEYTEAGIEQRCLGANSPEPRRRAVPGSHVGAQKPGSYITARPWLPGLIVGPCPSEESLCCPACPPPPFFFFADSRPPSLKLRVSFPCMCSPPVCIIRSVISLSLATTTWTPEHPFFSTHCYPNTLSDSTCVLGGGSFPVTTHRFSSRGVAAVRARRLFPSTISGVRGSVPVLPLGQKLDWQPVLSRAPKGPHLAVLAAAHSPF